MKLEIRIALVAIMAAISAFSLAAQPVIGTNGIVNGASYAPVGLPNAAIAQGSVFVIFGTNIGPDNYTQVNAWPLPARNGLAGVSIEVAAGGQTYYAIMLWVAKNQVAAILPSNVPVGQATLTLVFNGTRSNSQQITIARNSVGLFAQNQAGSGPGVVDNWYSDSNQPRNTIVEAAQPGQTVILWGTGLGAVAAAEEASKPLPGDLQSQYTPQLYVGGQRVAIDYAGRSGCCAGLDQIVFKAPSVYGCYVPIMVKVNNVISNVTSMAITPTGRTCSDSMLGDLDSTYVKANGLKTGVVSLSRTSITMDGGPLGTLSMNNDGASAVFEKFTYAGLIQSRGSFGVSNFGACTVITFRGESVSADPAEATTEGLDAGAALTLTGPDGSPKTLAKTGTGKGVYSARLSSIGPTGTSVDYFRQGRYTVTNGSGGADVVGFSATIDLPAPLVWREATDANFTSVTRSSGVTVNWTGGAGTVEIIGASMVETPQQAGAEFICMEDASRLKFTVPPEVLLALPPSQGESGGFMMVGNIVHTPKITPPQRLDQFNLMGSFLTMKTVRFQ